jgi:hypothetical protein
MNLKEQLRESIAAVAPFSQSAQVIEASEGNRRLSVELVSLDRLGCAIDRFSLVVESLKGASSDRLKQIAERLSASLTYLLEPISPIEIDAHGCTVQMRSNPPQKDADRTTYYELLVQHTGELSLCRYVRPFGGERAKIPAEITREVLLRLVGDFDAAAQ